MTWVDERLMWRLVVVRETRTNEGDADGGSDGGHEERCVIWARFVVLGVGILTLPSYPTTIKGIKTFKGPTFHSTQWDHSVDLKVSSSNVSQWWWVVVGGVILISI